MKNKFTNNWSLKLLAVIVAILVWVIVVNVSDPIIESTYSGVQVEILNGDLVAQNNQTYEILNDSDTITVTVMAKRSINDLLGKDNIRATADMSELNEETGTVRIRLETNKYNDKLESIKSKTDVMEVRIENLMRKQLGITPVVNGEPLEGFVTGDVLLDQNVVSVQGPESVVSRISYATAEVSVAGMSSSISTTSAIRYYDENGEQLDAKRLNGNISSVSVKVDVLATKNLPVSFHVGGTPAEAYGIDGELAVDKEEVLVAGKQGVLAGMNMINIPAAAIDATGKDAPFTIVVDITKYLPENVKIAEEGFDGKITVEVPIAKMEPRVFEIPRENIEITGFDEKKQRISLTGSGSGFEVSLYGLPGDLDAIEADALKATIAVDAYTQNRGLSALSEGVYDMPVELVLPGGVTLEEDIRLECRVKDIDE